MTRDDILQLAIESGLQRGDGHDTWSAFSEDLADFADALIERCAAVADAECESSDMIGNTQAGNAAEWVARNIRAMKVTE